MKYKLIILSFIYTLNSGFAIGQNLIPNSSFETVISCPAGVGSINGTSNWFDLPIHTGSADFLHTCATSSLAQVPGNVFGSQLPYQGNGYIGLALYYQSTPEFREYAEVQLTSPLVAGITYVFNCYVSLAEISSFGANSLGAFLSPTQVVAPASNYLPLTTITPQMTSNTVITDKVNWTNINMSFVATGGEQYLVLGNFKNDANTTVVSVGTSSYSTAYIYIDSVSLKSLVPQNLSIIGDSTICLGTSTTLIASGGSNYQWAESTNPSTIIFTGDSLVVSPNVNTTYYVYSNLDTAIFNVYVSNSPTVFLGNDTTLCQGSTFQLDATTLNATYFWQDSSTSPIYNISQPGLYWVTATINDCSVTDSIHVTYIPFPSLDLGNDTTLCQGSTLQLNATTLNATYLWQDSSTSPTYNISQQGLYWVTATTYNCSVTDSIYINYTPLPSLNLGNDTTLCQGSILQLNATTLNATYLWQDNSTSPMYTINQQGLYWVTATINNCSVTDSIYINYILFPTFNLGNDTTLCEGSTLQLDATTLNATYLWQDNTTSPMYNISQQGLYWVTATINNCSVADSIQINYIPYPTIHLGNDTTLCQGATLQLNASSLNATYLWQDNSTSPIYNISEQGLYWVTATRNNCSVTDSIKINYILFPSLHLGNDTMLCEGSSLQLDATTLNATYLWQDNSTKPMYNLSQQGLYWVEVTVSNCNARDSIIVYVETCDLIVPNAFSPNSDGLNDEFNIIKNGNVHVIDFTIYNRWGQMVFNYNGDLFGWDGKFKGQNCEVGTYFYLIKYQRIHNDKYLYKTGDLHLIR